MTVYLVGAGPGDPELLTLRAARLLATADVVVVDRLVDPRVLEMIAPGTHVIDAGKRSGAGDPTRAQARIIEQLLDLGRRHDTVVRLKGGDPFVFGRGAEELDALSDAGIDVEVVPGLTSALAVPALAGVAVTERGIAASVTIVSVVRPSTSGRATFVSTGVTSPSHSAESQGVMNGTGSLGRGRSPIASAMRSSIAP